jgi:hypothetical protein
VFRKQIWKFCRLFQPHSGESTTPGGPKLISLLILRKNPYLEGKCKSKVARFDVLKAVLPRFSSSEA